MRVACLITILLVIGVLIYKKIDYVNSINKELNSVEKNLTQSISYHSDIEILNNRTLYYQFVYLDKNVIEIEHKEEGDKPSPSDEAVTISCPSGYKLKYVTTQSDDEKDLIYDTGIFAKCSRI